MTRRLVVAAQLLTLGALATGLQFVISTTGGTLTLFAALAPLLVVVSIVILVAVFLHHFRERHKLFDFEDFEAGDTIISQGDKGHCAYFIRRGEVEIIREKEGVETTVAKLGEGDYFGEMSLLSEQPRNATVRALTEIELAVLGKNNFLNMLSVLPDTEADILKTIQDRAMKKSGRPRKSPK